jgi:hypothetical protein
MSYTNETIRRAERILGYGITCKNGSRTYRVIDGTVYADVFEDDEPTLSGYTGAYVLSFNGQRNGVEYYNQIELTDRCLPKEVTIDTEWGSDCLNKDLKSLLDWLEANPGADNFDDLGVSSKKVEDFSVNLKSGDDTKSDMKSVIANGWSWYVRSPLIIGVSPERNDDWRHF